MTFAANHRDLDLTTLEQMSAGAGNVAPALCAELPQVRGSVVLSTCNRFEVHLDLARPLDPHETDELHGRLAAVVARAGGTADRGAAVGRTGIGPAEVRSLLRTVDDPVTHLMAVASGLDSMVVGEREIAGQVRRALTRARAAGTSSPPLQRAFDAALRTSRAVANDGGLGGAGRSVVSVALDLAEPGLPDWTRVRCVLVGTGSYARVVLASLRSRGCTDVAVFSPSGRAAPFATARGLRTLAVPGPAAADPAVPDLATPDLAGALGDVDLVVTCSGTTGHVLAAGPLAAARTHGSTTLTVVDLALRPDVDPAVGQLPDVRLVTLGSVAARACVARPGGADAAGADTAGADAVGPDAGGPTDTTRAWAIVHQAAREQRGAERSREWSPAVVAQRRRVLARLGHRRAHALLHGPTLRAHAAARAGDLAAFEAALDELRDVGRDVCEELDPVPC